MVVATKGQEIYAWIAIPIVIDAPEIVVLNAQDVLESSK